MTPFTPTDAARKALCNLTKVQKGFVLDGSIHGSFSMATVHALKRKGLFHLVIDSPNARCGFMRLTPLGESVRKLLVGDGRG
jgi:hypothetical protein